jgi:hypothetical protein
MEDPAGNVAARLRAALQLSDVGLALMRQNLRRRFPDAGPREIERLLLEWRLHRTDAPHGDAVGRVATFQR